MMVYTDRETDGSYRYRDLWFVTVETLIVHRDIDTDGS